MTTYELEIQRPMLSPREFADRRDDIAFRTVQRYLPLGRIEGAVQGPDGRWQVPADARILPGSAVTTTPDVRAAYALEDVRTPDVRPAYLPPGLHTLEEVAAFYGTTPSRIRLMGEHPRSPFVVGRFGEGARLRVWVL
jgi:hypothetical protein